MNEKFTNEEYEALATVLDTLIILNEEISKNMRRKSPCLSEACEFIAILTKHVSDNLA